MQIKVHFVVGHLNTCSILCQVYIYFFEVGISNIFSYKCQHMIYSSSYYIGRLKGGLLILFDSLIASAWGNIGMREL